MPKPRKGESKDDYISRCIPYMIKKEGKKQDQAVAICFSYWKRKNESKIIEQIEMLTEIDYEKIYYNGQKTGVDPKLIEKGKKELSKKFGVDKKYVVFHAVSVPGWKNVVELYFNIMDKNSNHYKSTKSYRIQGPPI